MRRGDLVQRVERRGAALGEVIAGPLGARGRDLRAARPVFSGEESRGQPVVGQHGQVVRVRDGRERALEVPLDEVVVRLEHGELGQPELALQLKRRGEPLRRVVGRRDVPDHALLDERVEGAQRLLQRRVGVVPVRVIQIDVVGLQPLERGMRLAADVVGPQVAVRIATAADLRGEHDLVAVAAVFQPAPEDRLRPAMLEQVGVGGVDEVAPCRRVGVEDLARLLLVGGPAEHVAAQADGIDIQLRTPKGNHAANLSRPAFFYRHQ